MSFFFLNRLHHCPWSLLYCILGHQKCISHYMELRDLLGYKHSKNLFSFQHIPYTSPSSIEGPINNICLRSRPCPGLASHQHSFSMVTSPLSFWGGRWGADGHYMTSSTPKEHLPPAACFSASSRTTGDVRWIVRVRGGSLEFLIAMLASRMLAVTSYFSSVMS